MDIYARIISCNIYLVYPIPKKKIIRISKVSLNKGSILVFILSLTFNIKIMINIINHSLGMGLVWIIGISLLTISFWLLFRALLKLNQQYQLKNRLTRSAGNERYFINKPGSMEYEEEGELLKS